MFVLHNFTPLKELETEPDLNHHIIKLSQKITGHKYLNN